MTFLTDGTAVKFTGIDHTFNVYSTFVEFNIGSSAFSIKFYGLIIAFGFLLAVLFGGRMAYKWKMDLNKMLDVLLYGTIGGIIGARLYYVAFEWDYYSQNLSEIPNVAYRKNAIVAANKKKMKYVSLDNLTFDIEDYMAQIGNLLTKKQIIIPIESGRGCHWNRCHFCYL